MDARMPPTPPPPDRVRTPHLGVVGFGVTNPTYPPAPRRQASAQVPGAAADPSGGEPGAEAHRPAEGVHGHRRPSEHGGGGLGSCGCGREAAGHSTKEGVDTVRAMYASKKCAVVHAAGAVCLRLRLRLRLGLRLLGLTQCVHCVAFCFPVAQHNARTRCLPPRPLHPGSVTTRVCYWGWPRRS